MADIVLTNLATIERADQRGATRHPKLPPRVHPALDQRDCAGVEAYPAQAIPLAVLDGERRGGEIHILRSERQDLADAQPTPPGKGDHRPVPDPGRRSVRAGPDQRLDLLPSQKVGVQPPG